LPESLGLYLLLLFISMLFSLISFLFIRRLIYETKTYLIENDFIEVLNYLTTKREIINKSCVKGFSTTIVPYRIARFKQISIYLINGDKLTLMQFSYFNFSKIKNVLIENNYKYFGQEDFKTNWTDNQVYKFDKEN